MKLSLSFEEEELMSDIDVEEFTVEKIAEREYSVSGKSIDMLIKSVNFSDYESLQWFQRTLRKSGIIDALKEAGCEEGDSVHMGDLEFDYIE